MITQKQRTRRFERRNSMCCPYHNKGDRTMAHLRTEPLSQSELKQYREEGWVTLGRIMDDAILGEIRLEEARLRGDPAGQLTVFRSQLAHYSEPIRRHVTSGPQVKLASQLIGS